MLDPALLVVNGRVSDGSAFHLWTSGNRGPALNCR
jgi:hypothetical protein